MIRNYFKIILRNLVKNRLYSIINIFGLAVGMAATIFILLWLFDELSYDTFHDNADRIYRVAAEFNWNGQSDKFAKTPAPLAPALSVEFPEVNQAVRVHTGWKEFITHNQKQFWVQNFALADMNIFQVFTFPLIKGNPEMALLDRTSIVISEELAQKFFADQNPIGKILQVGTSDLTEYKITGVFKKIPSNSQLQFDCLVSFACLRSNIEWGHWNYTTYLLLPRNYSPQLLEKKFPDFIKKYIKNDNGTIFFLQQLTRIHLHSNLRGDFSSNRSMTQIYLFSAIVVLLLVVACINYMNLAIAKASSRTREVSIRKVVGAQRSQLIIQFLVESLLLSICALFVALALVELFKPLVNFLTGKQLGIDFPQNWFILFSLFVITILTGFIAGSYPALVISGAQVKEILAGTNIFSASGLRKNLLIIQFTISITFLICSMAIRNQITYLKEKDPGYTKEQLVVIPIFYHDVKSNYEIYKNQILQHVNIINATATSFIPGEPGYFQNVWWQGMAENNDDYMDWIPVDEDFLKTFRIELLQGRDFSREFSNDKYQAYILNESAVKKIGWSSPLNEQLKIVEKGPVIGVVKDFHFKSLHNKIGPVALCIYPEAYNYLIVRISPAHISDSIELLRQNWEQLFPNRLFDYTFFDEKFDYQYKTEAHLGKIFNSISGLALLIACLGLFGLVSYTLERRTKEIGIRRILGATTEGIMLLLSKDIMRWIIIAAIIACPIGWYAMHKWLQNFAYRIEIGLWVFLLGGGATLVIALFTVSWQVIRAAMANPADCLKYE